MPHTIATGTPAASPTPAMPEPAVHLHHAYWGLRHARLALGRCYCNAPLDPERIREKRLCAECESKDAERVRRLNADGLQG